MKKNSIIKNVIITTIPREITSTFDSSRKIKTYFDQFGKVFWIRDVKFNGNNQRARHLRQKTPVHEIQDGNVFTVFNQGRQIHGSRRRPPWASAIRIMATFEEKAGPRDAGTGVKWVRAVKQSADSHSSSIWPSLWGERVRGEDRECVGLIRKKWKIRALEAVIWRRNSCRWQSL